MTSDDCDNTEKHEYLRYLFPVEINLLKTCNSDFIYFISQCPNMSINIINMQI